MSSNKYCVIMAGGIGTRFWPKSRQSMPKQFLDILGTGKSFIRHTYERFAKMVPAENFLVVTNDKYKSLVLEHIPEIGEKQVLCEPVGRNTAPCVAYAAYTLLKRNPDAEMIVTPADHLILNEDDFRAIIAECLAFEKYLPEHHALFSGVMRAIGTDAERNVVEIAFSECRAISIDYGIMEKADNVYVRCGEFGWSDVGTWGSVYQHSRKDRYANAVPEEGCYLYDTRSSIVSLPKDKIAVISGLKEYIVVDTDDVLMVCPRSEEQNIKKFIDEVKFHNGDKHI